LEMDSQSKRETIRVTPRSVKRGRVESPSAPNFLFFGPVFLLKSAPNHPRKGTSL
jgi:hypothetical protein